MMAREKVPAADLDSEDFLQDLDKASKYLKPEVRDLLDFLAKNTAQVDVIFTIASLRAHMMAIPLTERHSFEKLRETLFAVTEVWTTTLHAAAMDMQAMLDDFNVGRFMAKMSLQQDDTNVTTTNGDADVSTSCLSDISTVHSA